MSEPVTNITQALVEAAAMAPDQPAMIFGGQQLTFSELDSAVWRAAAHFTAQGAAPGDVLALCLTRPFEIMIALMGAMRMGATAMPLSADLTAGQRRNLIREAGARFQILHDPSEIEEDATLIRYDPVDLPHGDHRHALDRAPKKPCKILVGSGSTGKPLLIPVSHSALHARCDALAHIYGFQPGERFMFLSPAYFATSITWLFASLNRGVTGVFWNRSLGFKGAIEIARPDYMHLSVLHAHGLLAEARKHPGFDLSQLKLVSIGASPVSEDLRTELRTKLKASLCIHYGTNETGSLTFAYPDDLDKVRDTVGRPQHRAELQILDPSGQPLGAGEIGEIRIRGPAVIDAYHNGMVPERFRDGWFHPGDLGRWEDDGQLVHCGRADQMMILDGINIYPAEIERCLEHHPAVNEVASFPIPHPAHGTIPACVVSLKPGSHATQSDLSDFARRELGLRRPRLILIVDILPRNSQGKLIRDDIRRRLLKAIEVS